MEPLEVVFARQRERLVKSLAEPARDTEPKLKRADAVPPKYDRGAGTAASRPQSQERRYEKWTEHEDCVVRQYLPLLGAAAVAREIGRGVHAVEVRANKLGVKAGT